MAAAKCSSAEFLAIWDQHRSPTLVARALGVSERSVHGRRKRLEAELGQVLPMKDQRLKFRVQKQEYSQNVQMGIEDGVVLVMSDAHFWPNLYSTAYVAFLYLIAELQPKAVIANGDVFDGAQISRHPRIGWDKTPSVIQELKACSTALGEIEETTKKARHNAKLYWPLGNHDARFETFLAANASQYEHVHGFSLKDHFPAWQPCWSVWNGKGTIIKHRLSGGANATRQNAMRAGVNIITGHLHSLKVTPFDDYRGTRYGVDTGTLAEPRGPQFANYLEEGPTDWRSGFVVLTFHKGKLLYPEVVKVHGPGQVEFRGKVIEVAEVGNVQ